MKKNNADNHGPFLDQNVGSFQPSSALQIWPSWAETTCQGQCFTPRSFYKKPTPYKKSTNFQLPAIQRQIRTTGMLPAAQLAFAGRDSTLLVEHPVHESRSCPILFSVLYLPSQNIWEHRRMMFAMVCFYGIELLQERTRNAVKQTFPCTHIYKMLLHDFWRVLPFKESRRILLHELLSFNVEDKHVFP